MMRGTLPRQSLGQLVHEAASDPCDQRRQLCPWLPQWPRGERGGGGGGERGREGERKKET